MELREKIKAVGLKIKMLRTRKCLKQQDVAKQMEISQAYLSNIESGRHAITLENLFKLQEILGCRMADFFAEIDADAAAQEHGTQESFTLDEVTKLLQVLRK